MYQGIPFMRNITFLMLSMVVGLAACAAQSPADQLSPQSPTVRLCNGNTCTDQDRRVATGQAAPADADHRMQALAAVAERDANAAYDLGLRLLRGDGVERNSYQALQWLRKAGDNGHMQAQLALGRIYLMGFEEMGSDPAEAEAWLTRAAAKGSKEARDLLPQAQAAKKDEQSLYQVREAYRKSWLGWYSSYPYYWVWDRAGWRPR
ncbi:tetratricopeptide repeat protein [Cupriavidus taiwanensis]|uniref:tetratricopeptide repeat protein n=1 Tax=Cupriavidus taiwanensis TaxID=164546 RepID=UPI001F11B1A3|nr:sel1 repeat family protein [Cupriavidus taiwanensis]